ncbi:unnamed protein product [Heterobilharzia americana]|nr:unnamed protein product [Heterobilharzia americana]
MQKDFVLIDALLERASSFCYHNVNVSFYLEFCKLWLLSKKHPRDYGSSTAAMSAQSADSFDPSADSVTPKTDGTSDSDFDERDVSAEDDDSIPPEEDAADEEEVSSLMKESEMSLDELLATYGIPSNINDHSVNSPISRGRPIRLKSGRRTATPPSSVTSSLEPSESLPPAKKPRRSGHISGCINNENNDTLTARSVSRNRPVSSTDQLISRSTSDADILSDKNKSDESLLRCLTSFTYPHSVPCSHSASPVSIDVSCSDPSSAATTPKHSKRITTESLNGTHKRVSRSHLLRSRAKSNPTVRSSSTELIDNGISSNTEKQVLSDPEGDIIKENGKNDDQTEETEEQEDTRCVNNEDYSSRFWKNAVTGQETPLSYNSDEDEDYCPSEDSGGHDWKGEIKVGDEYQANVPMTISSSNNTENQTINNTGSNEGVFYGYAERVFQESSLVWKPCEKLSEADVTRFERTYAQVIMSTLPNQRTIDDEEALFLLMRCDYDVEEALQRLQSKAVLPSEVPGYLDSWSEPDCTAFEKSFAIYGKDFRQIRETRLRHKTVSELIHFYYLWKKTARHDEFARIYRRDKKKSSHPNITDFMDCLAMEQEILAESYMQNVSDVNMLATTPVVASSSTTSGIDGTSLPHKCENNSAHKSYSFQPVTSDDDAPERNSDYRLDSSVRCQVTTGQKAKGALLNCDEGKTTESPVVRLKESSDGDANLLNKLPSSLGEFELMNCSITLDTSVNRSKSKLGVSSTCPPATNEACSYMNNCLKQADQTSSFTTRSTRTSSSSSSTPII